MLHTRILLLENDLRLAESLMRLFERHDWLTSSVVSLKEARQILSTKDFSLIVIDRILDDGDGLEIIDYLVSIDHPMMRLCLTSKSDIMERLKGLGAGADDYLPKPFATQELVLRIQNLLTKERRQPPKLFRYDELAFNPDTGFLQTPIEQLYLRRRENQILSCLLRHRKSLVTRQMLAETLWPGGEYGTDNATLDVYVRRLRITLGEYGTLIKTIRGYGYILAA